jgi:chemotaxis family two-component system sensor kinase Cph1
MAGRKVEIDIRPLGNARVDPSLFGQVFANLVGNAVKFTRDRPVAHIEVGRELNGAEPVYFVSDDGAGFDMRHADRLFHVFQRLHRRDEFDGTGIGLANVARIVDRHGGRVWATGELGKGATFYFTIGG